MSPAPSLAFDSPRVFPVAARVLAIKQTLVARFLARSIPMALIREAIAAAESQAWLSGYPDLFLPDLAGEILDHLGQKHARLAQHQVEPAHLEYAHAA
jgi:hypothetical protein